jgi:hypothetical protein
MKKSLVILLYFTIMASAAICQSKTQRKPNGHNQSIGFGINVPVGDFFSTHLAGLGADYAWSHQRFGLLTRKPAKSIGFTANGGIDYYFGKHDDISPAGYHFPAFIYTHAYAGAIYNPSVKTNICLSAGPAVGIYNNYAEFWWGIKLEGSYYFNQNISITPGIALMKQSIADPLIVASIKVTMAL